MGCCSAPLWEAFRFHKHLNVATRLSDYEEFVEGFFFAHFL